MVWWLHPGNSSPSVTPCSGAGGSTLTLFALRIVVSSWQRYPALGVVVYAIGVHGGVVSAPVCTDSALPIYP